MTIYAIGDIHGHIGLLLAAHARIEADRARTGMWDAEVIHVGDLVDRGPNSAAVVSYLMRETARDPRIIVLKGNHDHLFLRFLDGAPNWQEGTPKHPPWIHRRMGGNTTLASYGVDLAQSNAAIRSAGRAALPPEERKFLETLPLLHQAGECIFVHAGLRPGVAVEAQTPEDLMWIRDAFLYDLSDFGALVVHGHTPTKSRKVEHYGARLAIDTGAAYGGPLSAVAIEGRDVFLLTQTERVPIAPLL